MYSGLKGELFGARESGVEGRCVDDAARACVLWCRLWAVTGNVALRTWAEGPLDFVLRMHDADGRWQNFIYDWDGARNSEGPTSVARINTYTTARLAESRTDLTRGG